MPSIKLALALILDAQHWNRKTGAGNESANLKTGAARPTIDRVTTIGVFSDNANWTSDTGGKRLAKYRDDQAKQATVIAR